MTAQPLWCSPFAKNAAVIIVGLGVGTGGTASVAYFKQRGEVGYEIIRGSASLSEESLAANQVAVDLESIRLALRISVSVLGNLFDVTRQSVYLWMRGETPGPDRLDRISELANAIAPHAEILYNQVSRPGLRKLADGKTVVEALTSGNSATDVVNELASLLAAEASNRHRLASRLKARKRSGRGEVDNEYSA